MSGKRAFARKCGSSFIYFEYKLFHHNGPKRVPRYDFIARMIIASNKSISTQKAVEYFFTSAVKKELAKNKKEENKKAA